MAKTDKILREYNAKNGKYKMHKAGSAIADLTWLSSVGLDVDMSETSIYGDGEEVLILQNDNGYNLTLSMTAADEAFDIANGLSVAMDNGQATVKRTTRGTFDLYFETNFIGQDGIEKLKKVWVYNVSISKPSKTLNQNTENINANDIDYTGVVRGINAKEKAGVNDYIDPTTGMPIKVFRMSCSPGETGFATFGDAVPVPKMKS